MMVARQPAPIPAFHAAMDRSAAWLYAQLRFPWLRRFMPLIVAVIGVLAAVLFLLLTILPRSGRYATYTVVSDSMQPAIPIGSVVVVVPADPRTLKVGEVVSYTSTQPPYPTLTHRIKSIGQDADGKLIFKTKGDFNLVDDPWDVRYKDRAALVVASVPLAGYVLAAMTTGPARLLLGLLLAALLAFFWLTAVWARPLTSPRVDSMSRRRPPAIARARAFSPLRVAILGLLVLALIPALRRGTR